jgi:hypothetical protein
MTLWEYRPHEVEWSVDLIPVNLDTQGFPQHKNQCILLYIFLWVFLLEITKCFVLWKNQGYVFIF